MSDYFYDVLLRRFEEDAPYARRHADLDTVRAIRAELHAMLEGERGVDALTALIRIEQFQRAQREQSMKRELGDGWRRRTKPGRSTRTGASSR